MRFLMLGDVGRTYSTLLSLKPLAQQLIMIPDWSHSKFKRSEEEAAVLHHVDQKVWQGSKNLGKSMHHGRFGSEKAVHARENKVRKHSAHVEEDPRVPQSCHYLLRTVISSRSPSSQPERDGVAWSAQRVFECLKPIMDTCILNSGNGIVAPFRYHIKLRNADC